MNEVNITLGDAISRDRFSGAELAKVGAILSIGATFLMCNAFAEALTPFPHIVGAASALFGCMQIAGGFLATSLIASFHFNNQEPLAIIYLALGVMAFIVLLQLPIKKASDSEMVII